MNIQLADDALPKKEVKFFVLDITLKGGIERFVANMATMLSKHGFHVTIYSFHRTYPEPLYKIPSEVETVYLTQLPFRNVLYKAVTFLSCLRVSWIHRSFRQPFLVISTHPITTILFSLLCPGILPCTIASEHSTYLAHGAFIRAIRLRSYKKIKCVVTQTKDGAERFSEAGVLTFQIPNACTDFDDPRQWVKTLKPAEQPFTCLSVGRFEAVKQLDHYIEMAQFIHQQGLDICFELVGAGPLEAQLRNKIKQHGMENVFRIHAPTPQVNYFYCKAHAYIITSESEAFPMTMIEALSFGVPVLSYDGLAGPKEVIRNGYNGFLCTQNDPVALAAKVLTIYRTPSLYQKLTDNALQSAKVFHPQVILSQWIEAI